MTWYNNWADAPLETLSLYGIDLIKGLYYFKRGNWKTLKGAQSYLHEETSPFQAFCFQAAEGKINIDSILKRIADEETLQRIFFLGFPEFE